MKKILSLILVFVMLINCNLTFIQANENFIMSNIQEIEIEEDNLNRAFTYYSLSDNFTY